MVHNLLKFLSMMELKVKQDKMETHLLLQLNVEQMDVARLLRLPHQVKIQYHSLLKMVKMDVHHILT